MRPLAVLLLVSSAASCSLLVDLDECVTDADCRARGAGFVCQERMCVVPPGGGAGECTGLADCRDLGVCYACREGACVAPPAELLDEEGKCACRTAGSVDVADALLLGTLLPVDPDNAEIGVPMELSFLLALEEINETSGGVREGRKLGAVLCNTFGSKVRGAQAARYLVEDVGVRAIVGPAYSGVAIEVASQVTIAGDAVIISPSASNPGISDLDDHDLVWRLMPSDALQGVALASYVAELRGSGPDTPTVAALYKDDAYGRGLNAVFAREIIETGGADWETIAYPDPGEGGLNAAEYAVRLAGLSPLPSIVVGMGTTELTDIIQRTEEQWPAGANRPLWLLSDGGRNPGILEAIAAGDDLLDRVRGTYPDPDEAVNYRVFASNFLARHGAQWSSPPAFTEQVYDATYLLALALATFDGEPSGVQIAQGLRALIVPGQRRFNVGVSGLTSALSELRGGGRIDLDGASGLLELDEKGDPPGAIQLWWVTEGGGGAPDFEGERYMDADGTLHEVVPPGARTEGR